MDRYAVMGNPISHSKSPSIHRLFATQTGQALTYDRIQPDPAAFAEEISAFFAQGGKGLNLTVPFKEEAFRYADELTPRAQKAGAVNTLMLRENGSVLGDNTDGAGLVADLHNLGWQLTGSRVLLLGAGGAARGVVQPLLEENPARLVIANRTPDKARAIAEIFTGRVEFSDYSSLAGQAFDLIINATSASLGGELPPLPNNLVTLQTHVYDMMYGSEPTVFLRWAQEQGAGHLADGLGMLVEQAAEAFHLWRSVRPQTAPVINALRAEMKGQIR
jgi:shikimate dehydrogenase